MPNYLQQIAQDLRFAVRAMRANPLFTATAALSLALGIGANTAIYSFMDAILLRALPVQHPEELVIFHWRSNGRATVVHGINGSARSDRKTGGTISPNFPFAAYQRFTDKPQSLSNLFAYAYVQSMNVVINHQADAAAVIPVSGTYYSSLGIVPAAGRLISPDDDRPGAPLVGVLSYDYWKSRFSADPAVVGQSILLDTHPLTIIGVSAPGFFGLDPAQRPGIFFPLRHLPQFALNPANDERSRFLDEHFYWVEIAGRLRPGVRMDQGQTALAAEFRQFAESTATSDSDRKFFPELWLESGSSGLDSLRQQYSQPLRVLMTMVGLILAIACANLANLLLSRSAARRREIAVRLSLGAGRSRIVRQLLTESLLLSVIGACLGLVFAFWGIRSITWLIANGRENFTLHAQLDWRVLGFTIALSLVAGVLFGLAPALQSTRLDLTPALKSSRAGDTGVRRGWTGPFTATRILVAAQIAMSLLLVTGATLFVRNLTNLESIDLGFNSDNLLVFTLNPRQAGLQNQAIVRFFERVRDDIRRVPGVRDVGLSNFPLVSYYTNSSKAIVPGVTPPAGQSSVDLLNVDQNFLRTMQIPIVMGRGIEERDIQAPTSVVVNQKFASTWFGNDNPIGRRFSLDRRPGELEIVGVARNAHYNSIQEETPSIVYWPYTQDLASLSRMFFQVRTAGNPLEIVNPIREIVRQANPLVLLGGVNTETRIIGQTIGQQRTFASLGTCFAVLALLIACVGLYGAMAYTVARRTSEIGIRMALGAEQGRILWMVIREVFVLATCGLAVGYFTSRQLTRWIESFLFGIKTTDPLAIAAAVSILLAATLAAGFAPAWRASRIHPMTALRNE